VSHGYPIDPNYCFSHYPSVFTDVAAVRKWIDAGIQVGSLVVGWWWATWLKQLRGQPRAFTSFLGALIPTRVSIVGSPGVKSLATPCCPTLPLQALLSGESISIAANTSGTPGLAQLGMSARNAAPGPAEQGSARVQASETNYPVRAGLLQGVAAVGVADWYWYWQLQGPGGCLRCSTMAGCKRCVSLTSEGLLSSGLQP